MNSFILIENQKSKIENFLLILFLALYSLAIQAQPDIHRVGAGDVAGSVIIRAMTDELQRNMDSLYIANFERPFFIQYAMKTGRLFQVQATMGALTGVNDLPMSTMAVQVLVGNYQLANINLSNSDYRSSGRNDTAPIDNNYDEIRRRLWLLTNNVYKTAIEEYGNKMASIRQLNLPVEVLELPDFTQLPPTTYTGQANDLTYNRQYWERLARECSEVFINYPDIFNSNVGIEIYTGETFSVNSEGSKLLHPARMIVIAVNAYTKVEDGEEITDRLAYYGFAEKDLPDIEQLKKDIVAMAENITALAKAPKMEESYTGPVMIENTALATYFTTELLAPRTGLVAFRTPLRSGGVERLMEERMNRRILATDISVKATPFLTNYNGQALVGSYQIDAQGVTPDSALMLIENGMLRALMNDRVPTRRITETTGNRVYTYQPQGISTRVSPGVLTITTSNGLPRDTLISILLETARIEGLDYAYIIRTLPAGRNAALYKISVHDASEQLVRAAVPMRIDLNRMKRSLGASNQTMVSNMIAGGVPVSIISPDAMVIEEVDIEKRNLQNTTKLPIVSNPLNR